MKEMLLGALLKSSLVELLIGHIKVECVSAFKLLAVCITSDLNTH